MKSVFVLLGLLGTLLIPVVAMGPAMQGSVVKEIETKIPTAVVPPSTDTLSQSSDIKLETIKKIITLEDANTVVLRGPVTGSSVGKTMKQLQKISRSISKNTPIYLVLDTPGGSISDGMDLIDFAKALPQKVNTITLFAASMGFHIAQSLDTRYIAHDGTLMSHRARVEGLGGQVKGELETRYKMLLRAVDMLDSVAASRLGMSLKDYEAMIVNEYWVFGFDAIGQKAADEQVLLKCGESLDGTDTVEYQTLFGSAQVTFSKCPLIKEPESVNMANTKTENRSTVETALKMSITNKREFVNQYITTARFSEIFK